MINLSADGKKTVFTDALNSPVFLCFEGRNVKSGEIVERGTHNELISLKGRYFDLYTYQAKI